MSALRNLEAHYEVLERGLDIGSDADYATLVVPNGNHAQPIHRWFHFKEGFSCDLFDRLDRDLGFSERLRLSLLDPFLGSGTTLLSAAHWASRNSNVALDARGIERNPFLYLLARAKIEAAATDQVTPEDLEPVFACAHAKPSKLTEPPPLSTFKDSNYFDPVHVLRLAAIRDSLLHLPDSPARRLGLLALASAVEPVSRLRRDGRTLRYSPGKSKVGPAAEFRRRLKIIQADLEAERGFPSQESNFAVYVGDGRRPACSLDDDFRADLTVFSPPYPNNIDYTEVYKLEAWILDFYGSAEEFRDQRRLTLRSHPSILFGEADRITDPSIVTEIDRLTQPIEDAVPDDRYQGERRRLIRGYVEDLALTLAEVRRMSADDAQCVIVVGNSLHGHGADQFLVAADLLIATVATQLGWEPNSLTVARRPVRRSAAEPRLRETLIFLEAAEKPSFDIAEANP